MLIGTEEDEGNSETRDGEEVIRSGLGLQIRRLWHMQAHLNGFDIDLLFDTVIENFGAEEFS